MRLHLLLSTRSRFLLVAVCVLAFTGWAGANPQDQPRRTKVVEVVEKVRKAVVNIHSERTVQGAAREEFLAAAPSLNRVNGMGTGIIIDPRGYIVTNNHVVEDVNLIRVRLDDGSAYTARVLARDTEVDLALLKIDPAAALPVMPLGTASDLMVGETVVAIGNAYGYEHTVSKGVISATNRDVTLNKDVSYKALIQTDASINPGNSGGPLLNINGELIGVNVAIRAGAQGIGFAIQVDTMIRIMSEMMSAPKRNGTMHGLICRNRVDCTPQAAIRSTIVERVDAATPAGKAGIQKGDELLQIGNSKVGCTLEVERAFLDRPAGDKVPVVLRRNGAEQTVQLVVQGLERAAPAPLDLVWKKLGVKMHPVEGEVVTRVNQQLHGGMAVAEILAEGAAAKAGIQRGDILVGLHQWETRSLDNVVYVLTHPDLATFQPLRFFIIRSGQVRKGWLQQVD